MKKYNVLGVMSGTSCDGLDIAYASFFYENDHWKFELLEAKSYEYSSDFMVRLVHAHKDSLANIMELSVDFGTLTGNLINQFISEFGIDSNQLDAIASHGHTVLHAPEDGYTLQIGDGNVIKAVTDIKTIYDFRSMDVANGGQGAPLVPVGDQLLFNEYDYCLNIGGIANYSFEENGVRKAKDICFANMILNRLTQQLGKPFDDKGKIARAGKVNTELLADLLVLDFEGKSLAIEQYEKVIAPILLNYPDTVENVIATCTMYTAQKIAESIIEKSTVYITGGGAHNDYLVELIKEISQANIIIPPKELIEFKEAILFGFLGVLKMENIPNCLASVTRAKCDSVGGVVV